MAERQAPEQDGHEDQADAEGCATIIVAPHGWAFATGGRLVRLGHSDED